ncbi:tRNA (adenosine(37)-N6)-threonylcarbamoyltransferase complex ATPase subunit type 1 TsaE [Gorillibacterium massiliense]|uniref:tRNA (adenosine(37)-N6)-threonylcarbamoyltransferase complex ATPase subunit type 1 TsaE n=1 Tax=Gorillibacterium massiliense TaxID=1280390 RepID=UPI0004B11F73|nr:tRNA (adenosine(37)-N6)-threonylcarbamoyltransferase complex ATPase subunit type 1 TsaE [Gorillibacterium massiliense]
MSMGLAYTYESLGLEDTKRLAGELAARLTPGSLVALDGDLGAGKTAFSKEIAACMGVKETVNSPTFTIIKEYPGSKMPLYHMDVYRITESEAGELGLDEYFYGEGVTLVEWASLIESLLPDERLSIFIEYTGPESRTFHLNAFGEPYASWCRAMTENGVLR